MMYRRQDTGRSQRRRGTSVTELALVLPVVLVFVLGAIDFAQVMFAYGTVSEAARAGARYAIAHGSASSLPAGPTANDANVQAVAQWAWKLQRYSCFDLVAGIQHRRQPGQCHGHLHLQTECRSPGWDEQFHGHRLVDHDDCALVL
jgi:hypothetical protein